MNRYELKKELSNLKISPWYYNIDGVGETDQKLCLKYVDSQWMVYYCERGEIIYKRIYNTESEACEDILKELQHLEQNC